MKNLLAGDIPYTTRTEWRQKATTYKNNKNLVVIKSHTTYKNNKITFLRGPLRKNFSKSADSFHQTELLIRYRELINNFLPKG